VWRPDGRAAYLGPSARSVPGAVGLADGQGDHRLRWYEPTARGDKQGQDARKPGVTHPGRGRQTQASLTPGSELALDSGSPPTHGDLEARPAAAVGLSPPRTCGEACLPEPNGELQSQTLGGVGGAPSAEATVSTALGAKPQCRRRGEGGAASLATQTPELPPPLQLPGHRFSAGVRAHLSPWGSTRIPYISSSTGTLHVVFTVMPNSGVPSAASLVPHLCGLLLATLQLTRNPTSVHLHRLSSGIFPSDCSELQNLCRTSQSRD